MLTKILRMALIYYHLLMHLVAPTLATVSGHSGKLSSKLFYRDQFDSGLCLQEASCIPLHNASCFGTSLPYVSTSIALAEDSISQFEVQDNLALWQGLRSVPRCWAVIQPLLCAVYMPKCENGSVFLPSQEMCRITRGPCRTVEAVRGWPSFLQCENKKMFPPRCRNPLQEVKFNTSYKCVPPLVETDNPDNWFHEVQGCGLQCQNPFYTKEEHNSIHSLLSVVVPVCFGVTTFTAVTFMISWKAANKYPAAIIFYINVCLAFVSFGWLIQFFPGAREEIVCSYDGTIRRKQPRSGEHLCSITFVLIYYFLMASLVWFVILAYAWHVFFKQTGTQNEIVKKKVAYFHLSAWSIPLVLTTTVMAMTEVDGDSMSGICFVGYADINMRIGFLLAPVGVAAVIGGFFMACVLYTLIKVKLQQNEEVVNVAMKKVIQSFILKIGVSFAFALLFIIASFACQAYDFLNRKDWEESLKDYIICLAMNSANRYPSMGELTKCQLKSKPSIGVVRTQILCLFGYAIIMSLWAWNREYIESWKLFFYRLCEPAEKDPATITTNPRLLSEALKRTHVLNHFSSSAGISHSTHDDIQSVASRDISTSLAAAFPRFLDKRHTGKEVLEEMLLRNIPLSRQYSSVSEISRQRSVDSFNQPNLDQISMLSYQISKHRRRRTKKERERLWQQYQIVAAGNRRGSDTSLQSSLAMQTAAVLSRRARIPVKVTKSTSTGDLGILPSSVVLPQPGSAMFTPLIVPPVVNNRPQIRRQEPVINHPFTHGMTDNSHHLGSRVPSVTSVLPRVTNDSRYTPSQCSVMPNSLVGVHPPVYNGNYNVMNAVPYNGYFNNGMYPPPVNGFYPGYAYPEYMYTNPYLQYSSYASCSQQVMHQQDILPMNPIPDSASETDFLPIKLSDSEYTDTGMRSNDDFQQMLLTQQLMQEHLAAQEAAAQEAAEARAAALIAAQSSSKQKSQEDCEASAKAKTPFLKKIWPFNKTNPVPTETVRPPSGRKTEHSEAPPPSPAESSKSLNDDELDDDVFVNPEETKENKRNLSATSLTFAAGSANVDSVFCKIKTKLIKFRRATSYMNNLEKIDTIEFTSRVRHSSLLHLSKTDSSVKNIEVHKEKWLHASEGISLMNGDASTEHVSR